MNNFRHPIVTEDLDRVIANPWPWELLAGSTVLVSGASGFLPGFCCEVLLRLNEVNRLASPVKVAAFSRNKENLNRRFAAYAGRSDLVVWAADARSGPPSWNGPADYVIHGASPASPVAMAGDILACFEANVAGTKNMLELARERRAKKFLFLSSGAVYGDPPPKITSVAETDFGPFDPWRPRAAYEEGKRAGETLCRLYADKFPVASARISHTYGPGLRPEDGRSFADFITAAAENRPLVLRSDGSAIRHFCYLSDTVAGLFALLLKSEEAQVYNVGGTEACSIRDLAQLIVELFPERRLKLVFPDGEAAPGAMVSTQRSIPLNTSKLRALGWSPRVPLPDGLRRAVLAHDKETTL